MHGSLIGEFQHGHMEQVGYDMYCKLLDEVMKETRGEQNVFAEKEPEDIQIELNVSSYIPDEYIENSDIKISIYQDIALCKNEDEILDVTDEIIDRFGSMPKEVENLLEIARIKNLCREKKITKINQRLDKIVFYFSGENFNYDNLNKIIEEYAYRVKFSQSALPYVTYKLEEGKPLIKQIKEFLSKF